MMRLVNGGIGIQSWIDHDSVDEVVYHGGDAIDATKSFIQRWSFLWLQVNLLSAGHRTRTIQQNISLRVLDSA
jgi:hypothetical protein